MARGIKREELDIFEDLFTAIWDRMAPKLGALRLASIINEAVYVTAQDYPLVFYFRAGEKGFDFSGFRARLNGRDKEVAERSLRKLVANFSGLVDRYFGKVLTEQLLEEVSKRDIRLVSKSWPLV